MSDVREGTDGQLAYTASIAVIALRGSHVDASCVWGVVTIVCLVIRVVGSRSGRYSHVVARGAQNHGLDILLGM